MLCIFEKETQRKNSFFLEPLFFLVSWEILDNKLTAITLLHGLCDSFFGQRPFLLASWFSVLFSIRWHGHRQNFNEVRNWVSSFRPYTRVTGFNMASLGPRRGRNALSLARPSCGLWFCARSQHCLFRMEHKYNFAQQFSFLKMPWIRGEPWSSPGTSLWGWLTKVNWAAIFKTRNHNA